MPKVIYNKDDFTIEPGYFGFIIRYKGHWVGAAGTQTPVDPATGKKKKCLKQNLKYYAEAGQRCVDNLLVGSGPVHMQQEIRKILAAEEQKPEAAPAPEAAPPTLVPAWILKTLTLEIEEVQVQWIDGTHFRDKSGTLYICDMAYNTWYASEWEAYRELKRLSDARSAQISKEYAALEEKALAATQTWARHAKRYQELEIAHLGEENG